MTSLAFVAIEGSDKIHVVHALRELTCSEHRMTTHEQNASRSRQYAMIRKFWVGGPKRAGGI